MIEVKAITKTYGKQTALNDVSMTIKDGSVTAIIGPNGAGKSTLMKCILGFVFPDKGEVLLNGKPLHSSPETKKAIGYMHQRPAYPENLTTTEIISFLRELRGNPASVDEELFDRFGFMKESCKKFRNLSGGNKQKVNAISAFLFNPPILILDEPTAGLDPVAAQILKEKIIKEKNNGKTVVLTSHVMNDIAELTDNLIVLLDGRIYYDGSLEELRNITGEQNISAMLAAIMKEYAVCGN